MNKVVSGKRMQGHERKDLIVKSAIEVFSKVNYRAAKVSDITDLANVSEPMLYKHFSSKEELYLYVLNTIIDKVIEKLVKISEKSSNPLEAIELSIYDSRRTISKYEKELKLQFGAFSEFANEDVKNTVQRFYYSAVDFYEGLICEGIKTGDIREDVNPNTVAWMIVGHTVHLNAFFLIGVLEQEYTEGLISNFVNSIRK